MTIVLQVSWPLSLSVFWRPSGQQVKIDHEPSISLHTKLLMMMMILGFATQHYCVMSVMSQCL